jgi:hypothetical protein
MTGPTARTVSPNASGTTISARKLSGQVCVFTNFAEMLKLIGALLEHIAIIPDSRLPPLQRNAQLRLKVYGAATG